MKTRLIAGFIICFLMMGIVLAGGEWHQEYAEGLEAMEAQDWSRAIRHFQAALQGNDTDNENVRTYGMHFMEYFPHRELGICYYNMGDNTGALRELQISAEQESSERAQEYLRQLKGNVPPPKAKQEEPVKKQTTMTPAVVATGSTDMIVGKQTVKLVGERMGVAILPFENKGASRDLGEIILDKMITVMVNQERFKVMERAQLDKILQEQSLGSSGIIDATTAAEIGKGIGVDAIIIGSVAATASGSISIDARVIDTESAAIIVAEDVYSGSSDAQSVKNAIENLSNKIVEDLPLVEGYIIRIDGSEVILDIGRIGGLKRGMKCIIYKEGAEIKHPITGEVLGKETKILGEVLVKDAFDKYSVANTLDTDGTMLTIGDKFLTK
jgi:hypothetical protein